MTSSANPSGTTLLRKRTQSPVGVPHGHGMRFFWFGVALIVALTAALGTWAITQSNNDTLVDSSTSAATGQLSPNAADFRDAQIRQQSSAVTSVPVSPNVADSRARRQAQQQSSATTSVPVSPNAADHRDASIQQQSSTTTSVPVSPNAAGHRDASIQQQSSATTSVPVSPNAADYRDAQ